MANESEKNQRDPAGGGRVDLGALRIGDAVRAKPERRPWLPRLAPAALALLVVAAGATLLGPLLTSRTRVRTAPVRRAADDGLPGSRAAVAEAAGWVEPDPFPVHVRPRIEGFVAELLVVEGDAVERDATVIARLDPASFELAVAAAEGECAVRAAEAEEARAALAAASALLESRLGPRRAARAAAARLADAEGRLARCRSEHATARAELAASTRELDLREALVSEGVSQEAALTRARAAVESARAAVEERGRQVAALERERAALAAAAELEAGQELEPVELRVAVTTAEARVAAAEASLARERAALERARTELSWTEVRAPADGVVLRVHAPPGAAVGPRAQGREAAEEARGSVGAIVSLYDPAKLQVRVDVPLGQVGTISIGQAAEVASEVLAGRTVPGTVTRLQRESDLLKNTLQVKVRLLGTAPLLVPETLCRVRFLAGGGGSDDARVAARFLVPDAAVRDGAVHVLDPRGGGRARRVPVERLGAREGEVLVAGELSVAQRVILDPVEDGAAIEEVER